MTDKAMLLKIAAEARSYLVLDATVDKHNATKERVQQLRMDLDWIAGTIENHLQEAESPSAITCAMAYERPPNRPLPKPF